MRPAALVIVAEQQPTLHLAADRAQRRGRQHAFRRAARPEVDIDAGFGIGGGHDAAHVAIADQHDAGAGLAYPGDQFGVPWPVEDANDEIGDVALFGLRQILQVRRGRLVEIDDAVGQTAADRDLVHVHVGRIEKPAVIGRRQYSRRVPPLLDVIQST